MPEDAAPPIPAPAGPAPRSRRPRTAEQRGRSLTYAVFIGFATLFIVWCTADITLAVFAVDVGGNGGALETTCAVGVRQLASAVDRALATRVPVSGKALATEATFDEALAPEWSQAGAVEERCSPTPPGARAFAAVSRYRYGAREAMPPRPRPRAAPPRGHPLPGDSHSLAAR